MCLASGPLLFYLTKISNNVNFLSPYIIRKSHCFEKEKVLSKKPNMSVAIVLDEFMEVSRQIQDEENIYRASLGIVNKLVVLFGKDALGQSVLREI